MKAKMLKIAGVKSEKEFYKKYPTEKAFMKAHGKEFKKAAMGAKMVKTQLQQLTDFGNPPKAQHGFDYGDIPGGSCGPNQYWDGSMCIDLNPTGGAVGQIVNPVPADFDYQEVQKFNTNRNLSTGTAKTGPGTGVNPSNKPPTSPLDKFAGTRYAGLVGKTYLGIKALKAEKERLNEAKKWNKVSGVVAQAASLMPEEQKRRYVRPEDIIINPEQLFPTYGTGYNAGFAARNGSVIRAQGGMQIGGNPTEIQNTYAPTNTLYDNLGWEPLNNNDQLKQYYIGGKLTKAQDGFDLTKMLTQIGGMEGMDKMGAQLGGSAGSWIGGGGFEENAGSQLGADLGGGVGEAVGKATGIPGMDKLLKTLGGFQYGLIGGFLDKKPKKTRELNKQTMRNIQTAALQSGLRGLQNNYSQYVEDGGAIPQHEEGGWVNHDWQPQVITKFGEHSMKDLLKADPMMDTLRTGGHITQNNIFPQDQYALGGSLKTTWGGYAEPISQNPYDESETVMFRGKSHAEGDGNGHTGIGVKYGDNQHDSYTDYAEYGTEQADADVEVERGEPAIEMIDPQTGEKNMVVFGNLKIPNAFVDLLGDPKAKNKKFKNYVNTLAKIEEKQNKKIDKASREIDELDVYTPFDKLKLDSLKATMMGANLTLKEASDRKKRASGLQNAINDTAAELGVDADALAKGKIKIDKEAMKEQAKWGAKIETAQTGIGGWYKRPSNSLKSVSLENNPYLESTLAESVGLPPKNYVSNIPATSTTNDGGKKKKSTTSSTSSSSTVPSSSSQKSGYVSKFGIKPWGGNKYGLKGKTKSPFTAEEWDSILENLGFTGSGNKEAEEFLLNDPRTRDIVIKRHKDLYGRDPWIDPEHFGYGWSAEDLKNIPQKLVKRPAKGKLTATITQVGTEPIVPIVPVLPKKRNKLMDIYNELLPFIRPSDQEPLDPRQLAGEMYALSSNQLEPVQAQTYQPQLLTPYDISLQDQLNEVTAQSRAAERMAGNNPAAAMAIAAQADQARSKILGEQMRINQAQRMGVYNQNIAAINDAKLKNLEIYDQQYVRQSQAKSATKAVTQAALNSIADKYAKHDYENRTLGIYENLYNYRYDKSGRAINMNPLQQFGATVGTTSGSSGTMPNAPEGYEWDPTPRLKKKKEDESTGKNGAKIKSRNGSIVRAIKNL